MNSKILEIKNICDGTRLNRDIPEQAKQIAKENHIVVIVGGSDDLMYAFGAKCYLTDYEEHSEGWDGCDLSKHASESELQVEACQLGLKIFYCGKIAKTSQKIKDYDIKEHGYFYYTVNQEIEHAHFKVISCDGDVYCTGIIIQLPPNFKPEEY